MHEADQYTASKPKFRQLELTPNKLIGLCYATDELLQDSSALAAAIQRAFVEEYFFVIDDGILRGSGASQILGIINGGSTVTASKEVGQSASTFVLENALKMRVRLIPRAKRNAIWLIHPSVASQLYAMSLAVGTGGGPVYMPSSGAAGRPYALLLGRPVVEHESCSALGSSGDVILGSFEDGFILAQKGDLTSHASLHVRFLYGEQVFRFQLRIDGQPILASAITPYKSTNTIAHFCILEDR